MEINNGCHMDALQKRTESLWTITWLPHGCGAKADGVFVDINNGCHMDALQKRTESLWTLTSLPHGFSAKTTEFLWTLTWLPQGCSAKTDGVFVDVIMFATWMLCKNGRSLCGH